MTIRVVHGDMFESGARAFVCAANSVGTFGKGQALEIKRRFPEQTKQFIAMCKAGCVHAGGAWTCYGSDIVSAAIHLASSTEPLIVYATTKGHWRETSTVPIVRGCCRAIVDIVRSVGIASIAVPALGCGLGGLRWSDVQPHMRTMSDMAPECEWLVYEPLEA